MGAGNQKAADCSGFFVESLAKEALIKLLRDQILNLRCSLYSRTGAFLDPNFDRSLHLIGASLTQLYLLMNSPTFGQIISRQRRPEKIP